MYRIAPATCFRYRDKKCRKDDKPFMRVQAWVVPWRRWYTTSHTDMSSCRTFIPRISWFMHHEES